MAEYAPLDPFSTPITANGTTTIIATDTQGASMIERPESVIGPSPISTSNVFMISTNIVLPSLVVIALLGVPSDLYFAIRFT